MQAKTNDLVMFDMQQPLEKEWLLEEYNGEKKPRTLSQNSYYWKLLEMLAVAMKTPKMVIHNGYLRQLALTKEAKDLKEKIAGKPITLLIPDTEEADRQTLLAEKYHVVPTSRIKQGDDGVTYRIYVLVKGSHELSVNQMAALIEFAVQDAQAVGIETMTPAELEHLKQLALAQEGKKK